MPLPRPPKAVIFDMDGLLFDTERLRAGAMIVAAGQMGREMPLSLAHSMIGLPSAASRVHLVEAYGEAFDTEQLLWRTREEFLAREANELALKPGVVEILDELDAQGLPRGIATSASRSTAERHLDHFRLAERFHAVVTSGDYERGKPAPDPYLSAAARLQVSPADCLALEDSHNGVRAAAAAGMMAVMVPDMLPPTEEMHTLCVRVASDLNEVRGWLARLNRA